jgi:hypothetical protein
VESSDFIRPLYRLNRAAAFSAYSSTSLVTRHKPTPPDQTRLRYPGHHDLSIASRTTHRPQPLPENPSRLWPPASRASSVKNPHDYHPSLSSSFPYMVCRGVTFMADEVASVLCDMLFPLSLLPTSRTQRVPAPSSDTPCSPWHRDSLPFHRHPGRVSLPYQVVSTEGLCEDSRGFTLSVWGATWLPPLLVCLSPFLPSFLFFVVYGGYDQQPGPGLGRREARPCTVSRILFG